MNFFKIDEKKHLIETPFKIGELYLKGNFLTDVIAVIPYSTFNPYMLFLRYLKLLKFNTYLKYLEEFYGEILAYCLDIESIKIIMSMLKLLFQVIMVSHFFACFWVLIGEMDYIEYVHGMENGSMIKFDKFKKMAMKFIAKRGYVQAQSSISNAKVLPYPSAPSAPPEASY